MRKAKTCISRRGFIAASAMTSAASVATATDEKKAAPQATSTGESVRPGRMNSRLITVDAKPERVEIDTATTAVIVVDMQNDFAAKGGMIDRAGLDISSIQRAIGRIATVVAAARDASIKIIYLKMGYRPDLSDLGTPDSPNRVGHLLMGVGRTVRAPNGTESRILVRDTWSTDIV